MENTNNSIGCRELTPYQTTSKLIVLSNKCEPGTQERPGQILSPNSKIGITMIDYTNGTKDNSIKVTCNITPGQLHYLYERAKLSVDLEFPEDFKIFGTPEKDGVYKGLCPCSKLTIKRQSKTKEGLQKTNPWYIAVENGYGKKVVRENNSIYLEKGTYKKKSSVFFNMTDVDFFSMTEEAVRSIDIFCQVFCIDFVKEGFSTIRKQLNDYRAYLETLEKKPTSSSNKSKGQETNSQNVSSEVNERSEEKNSSQKEEKSQNQKTLTSSDKSIDEKTFDIFGTMELLSTENPALKGTYILQVMEGKDVNRIIFLPDVIKHMGKQFDELQKNIDSKRISILSCKVVTQNGKLYYQY